MDYSKYNMPNRADRKRFIEEVYTDKLFCDGCIYLKIHPPYRGPGPCDVNLWRDSYKCKCEVLGEMRLCSKPENIPRALICLLLDYYQST